MTVVHRRFLPDRLRPRIPRRRSHWRFLLPAAAVVVSLLVVPLWTVKSVEVRGGEVVPEAVTTSLEGLVGHLVPALELEWLHQLAASWPAASEVLVHLELPGRLVVEVFPESARGSVPVGAGWHAVAADGGLAGALDGPHPPELVGFHRPSDRRLAFSVARRLAEASGGTVTAVRQVTPMDYRVGLLFDGNSAAMVHVIPEGTAAEGAWCALVKDEGVMVDWADLRWPSRMVLGSASDALFARVLREAA